MKIEDIVFLDIESTGVEMTHFPWEVGVIDLHGNVLLHEMWKPEKWQMMQASSMALKMNKFYKRFNDPAEAHLRGRDASFIAGKLAVMLSDKVLCGASVAFDARMLDRFLHENGEVATWSHRLLDIETYVAGVFGYTGPASLSDTAKRAGIEYDKSKKHTALYDAWLARECYRACLDEVGADTIEKLVFEDLGKAPYMTGQDSAVKIPSMPRPPEMKVADKEDNHE